MDTHSATLSTVRTGLLAKVNEVIGKKRAKGFSNGKIQGHVDLVVGLNNSKLTVYYCKKCLILQDGSSISCKTCESTLFSVMAGE